MLLAGGASKLRIGGGPEAARTTRLPDPPRPCCICEARCILWEGRKRMALQAALMAAEFGCACPGVFYQLCATKRTASYDV